MFAVVAVGVGVVVVAATGVAGADAALDFAVNAARGV